MQSNSTQQLDSPHDPRADEAQLQIEVHDDVEMRSVEEDREDLSSSERGERGGDRSFGRSLNEK